MNNHEKYIVLQIAITAELLKSNVDAIKKYEDSESIFKAQVSSAQAQAEELAEFLKEMLK